MKFIVLSSSRGTTFQAVIDALKDGSLGAECLGLVTDRADRGCIEKARTAGLPVSIVERKKGENREAYDERLHASILELGGESLLEARSSKPEATVIACIGWMFVLSPEFVRKWRNHIVNVHPALLPKHPGAHAIQETLKSSDTESGMTIHIIDEGVDTGKILVQKSCSIKPGDTEDTLKTRIQELEKEWYPKVLAMIEGGEIRL